MKICVSSLLPPTTCSFVFCIQYLREYKRKFVVYTYDDNYVIITDKLYNFECGVLDCLRLCLPLQHIKHERVCACLLFDSDVKSKGNHFIVSCSPLRRSRMASANKESPFYTFVHKSNESYLPLLPSALWLASSLKLAARCPVSGCWPSCISLFYNCDGRPV